MPECEKCYNTAIYGFTKPCTRCLEHMDKGMFLKPLSKAQLCITCMSLGIYTKQGSFGISGQKYCQTHNVDKLLNIMSKRCDFKGCRTQPSYGWETVGLSIKCGKHKEIDMVDLKTSHCDAPNCKIICNYGLEGDEPTRCVSHKTPMMVDVKSVRCSEEKCTTQAFYGLDGGSATKCGKHKTKAMINIKGTRCNIPDCKTIASYGVKGNPSTRCRIHKDTNMVCKGRRCIELDCNTFANAKYNGHCARCYRIKYPDELPTYHYKLKEIAVVKDLKLYLGLTFMQDQPITNGDIKFRPDICYDFKTHQVIVEVDEHQHKRYTAETENKRILAIAADAKKSIFVVRFNPDHYYKDKIRIASPWKDDKVINEIEWNTRLDDLLDQVEPLFTTIPSQPITTIHMFYDC